MAKLSQSVFKKFVTPAKAGVQIHEPSKIIDFLLDAGACPVLDTGFAGMTGMSVSMAF